MHTLMSSRPRFSTLLGRTAAVTFFCTAGVAGLHAQQSSAVASAPISLKATLAAPLDLTTPDDLSYSSSVGSVETATAENFNMLGDGAGQPPPRRQYHRPNYSDSRTNPDGSAKYTFVVGGGFTLPTGGTHSYLSTGWKIQGGVGRNFNKTFGVIAQFDYDDFGFQTATLNNQLAIYNSIGADLTQLGGNTHDWSFSLNPIMNYYTSDTFGAYVIGGVGFYHKAANFTTPGVGTYCDPYYGCYQYEADESIDKYTSNAFGLNGGIGFTYKLSRFASTKFYAEARYVWTDNSRRPYDISGTTSYFNAFPQNSAPTTWIPVTFGLRF